MVVIDLVRHAQGHHNVSVKNLGMLDPQLTPLGEQQCAALRARYPYHDRVRMLVASPLRRTLRTCMLVFGPVDGVTPAAGGPTRVVAVPELQELSALPSDTGSPPAVLHGEFTAAEVDLSRVPDGWTNKGHGSPFAADVPAIEARARKARHILRALAADAKLGPDDRMAVVTHGGFLHFLTEEYEGVTATRGTGWDNAEWRSFVFADPRGQDEAALLKETDESWAARRGAVTGLTEQEQMELKLVFREVLAMENSHADSTGGLVRCKAAVAAEAKEKAAAGKAGKA